jgi:hypothetical protein
MESRNYYIKISPGVLRNDIFKVPYVKGSEIIPNVVDPCCTGNTTTGTTNILTGETYVYSSMTQVLTGGVDGTSLLTGLTIPILFTQSAMDFGYYTPFDGLVTQQDVVNNFLFTATTGSPFTFYFYNTSDITFSKFVSLITYSVDWGDGSPIQSITNFTPNSNTHTYANPNTFTISLSAQTPWGLTVCKKPVTVPYSIVPNTNSGGTLTFYSVNGNWSATPISYEYIYDLDANNNVNYQATSNFPQYTSIPFYVTGYTYSRLNDLIQIGPNKYPPQGLVITANTDVIGAYYGFSPDGTYQSYLVNGIDYVDYNDGTTIFVVQSSGLTTNDIVSGITTKDEVLMNVVMQPEVQSNLRIERGKNSALESVQRLGEVDNVGDLVKYGYGFFNVINIQ